jgi:CBS-domain-containing membrane protein
MIVRNWMQANPMVVSGDTLLSEAKRILTEHNLHGLPVVDGGRLRGLITRANCLRAAHFALRTQNTDELNFFSTAQGQGPHGAQSGHHRRQRHHGTLPAASARNLVSRSCR